MGQSGQSVAFIRFKDTINSVTELSTHCLCQILRKTYLRDMSCIPLLI